MSAEASATFDRVPIHKVGKPNGYLFLLLLYFLYSLLLCLLTWTCFASGRAEALASSNEFWPLLDTAKFPEAWKTCDSTYISPSTGLWDRLCRFNLKYAEIIYAGSLL